MSELRSRAVAAASYGARDRRRANYDRRRRSDKFKGAMKTYHLRITGKVQGVWYRASAKDKAIALGLNGKVWNNSDHSVGISIQGDESQIEQFIAWCKQGPPLARVENVEVITEDSSLEYFDFKISREE